MTGMAKKAGKHDCTFVQKIITLPHDWERLVSFAKTFAKMGGGKCMAQGAVAEANFGCRSNGRMSVR